MTQGAALQQRSRSRYNGRQLRRCVGSGCGEAPLPDRACLPATARTGGRRMDDSDLPRSWGLGTARGTGESAVAMRGIVGSAAC